MKPYLFILFMIISFSLLSQEKENSKIINELKAKIAGSEKGEKLKWMDSLIPLIEFNEDHQYTKYIQEAVKLALQLDSLASATKNTSDFIYYQNVILGDPKEGLKIFKEFKGKELKSSSAKARINFYIYGSDSYFLLKETDSALVILEDAKIYAQTTNEQKRLGNVYTRIGFCESELGHFANSSQNLQTARKIFLQEKDTTMLLSANNALSVLYSQNAFYKEAEIIRNESIELSKKIKERPQLFTLYFNAAADERMQKNEEKRIKYLKLAKTEVEASVQKNLYYPLILSDLVIAYAESDSLAKAETLFAEFTNNEEMLAKSINREYYIEALKQLSFAKGNYQEALKNGLEHLEYKKNQGSFVEIYNAEKFLAQVYKALGNTEKENQHLVTYFKIKDSISSLKNVQALSYYQTLYETEKRDSKIQAQESNIALLDEKNKVKNQWMLFGGLGFLSLFGFVWVVRSRNFARNSQKQQERFTKDLLKTQENERARIASELHDSVGQKLLMIKNALVSKETESKAEVDLVGETIKEVREMSHSLHPFQFEKLGLVTSLKNMVEAFQKNSNVFYSEEIELQDGLIDKEKEIYIFRMLQEAITNVEKHAAAKACNLTAETTKHGVIFTLRDNGKGFNPDDMAIHGLGMKTLKERASFIGATLDIKSTIGKGTTLTLNIPSV